MTVLDIIRKKQVSRAELARMTGLTRAAVSIIVEGLINEGILEEKCKGSSLSERGRKPVLLDIRSGSVYTIGVDVSRGGCLVCIIDIKGTLFALRNAAIEKCETADQATSVIIKEINNMIAEQKIPADKIFGVGISAPGPLDPKKGMIFDPPDFKMWHNFDIAPKIEAALSLKATLENNSTALAIAEKNYGYGNLFQNFLLLVVDTGIGSAIIINDRLFRGSCGFAGEIGHMTLNMDGDTCGCGNKGCLELYASIPSVMRNALKNEISNEIKNDVKLWDLNLVVTETSMTEKYESFWKEVIDKALDGNEFCQRIVGMEAQYLASGIVNAMNLLDLDAVILSGYIKYKSELLVRLVQENVDKISITRHIKKIRIMATQDKLYADIHASASIAADLFFQ